jgi:hypothetical protein
MSKKQSTLLAAIETTAAPADHDFVLDGERATLSLQVFTLTGTTPTIAVTATELFEKGYTLDYDAQTSNFTLGATVRGQLSGAQGVIMDDTDGGATGTLELKKVSGAFIDNELIVDDNGTPGSATVDGVLVRVLAEGSVWATIAATSGDAEAAFFNPDAGLSAGDERTYVVPRKFRLKVTEGGTWTAARFTVDLLQSGM